MPQKHKGTTHGSGRIYRSEREPAALLPLLPAIRALADSDKEALGFLPEAAYREAIEKHRLVAMCTPITGGSEIVGFILYSGVFPNARIQQIIVSPQHRRFHVASTLINDLVSQLESQGYLTLSAAVASDLLGAQAFYENNGFTARRTLQGGQARNRTIVLRARDLETESFFSILEPPKAGSQAIDLGLRQRSAGPAPLYAIDLNVLFDVIKNGNRPRSSIAGQLIGAALAHQIRLAVAPEFITELERQTKGEDVDPVLKLARQLPRLPEADRSETDRLSALIHNIVFDDRNSSRTGSVQSLSDARHLAQAALARASGYVTSDGPMLRAREQLLKTIGIDVASLDEFVALLTLDFPASSQSHLKGTDCATRPTGAEIVKTYLKEHRVPPALVQEFAPTLDVARHWKATEVSEAGDVVAIGSTITPNNIDAPARILVHVRSDNVACETFADHLLDIQCQHACRSGPTTIELPLIPGQGSVRRAATLRGFLPVPKSDTLIKVALGRPMTSASWTAIARQTRRRTGLRLPERFPDAAAVQSGILIQSPDGAPVTVRLSALEDALGPTIIVWPDREGVIVSIAKHYADDLLGTGTQMPLFGSPEASFLARRTYFNSPRTAPLMRPGTPILFYESKRSGGRGAVVAAARITDATVLEKRLVSDDLLRRAVVEDLELMSASVEVLATTFDNLLRFPSPVSLEKLRELGAEGSANLQTTTAVAYDALSSILELGWARAGRN